MYKDVYIKMLYIQGCPNSTTYNRDKLKINEMLNIWWVGKLSIHRSEST